jgi:hypothetical protein
MIQLIIKGARLSEENRPLLWIELVMFSIMSGLVCHSWLVLVIVTLGLVGLMTRKNGMFYLIFAISALWAFMPFCMGYAWGGLAWAIVLAGVVFVWAVKVHVNGLKWYWDEIICRHDDVIEWKRMGWNGSNGIKSSFEA